ncbi:MAG TPA: methyltransferase domain-containing protein [Thermoleophilia bacterium]|nr:methyltransferase domain-containing protein [Thermoleophilia bacterium]
MGHKFDPKNVARLDDPARLDFQHPDTILGLLQPRPGETIVDYGCGVGFMTLPLAAALPRGRVVAVDMSDELLDVLRARLDAWRSGPPAGGPTHQPEAAATRDAADRVEVVHTGANAVPLPDAAADAVLTVNLWHEIYDERPALDEIARLLAPHGRLVIVDWAKVERPAGPPAGHVLTLDEALVVVESLGLSVAVAHQPGTLFPYHYAIVARGQD